MALADISQCVARRAGSVLRPSVPRTAYHARQYASATARQQDASLATPAHDDIAELEHLSGLGDGPAEYPVFDPLAQSKARKQQLPSSRYQFRPPKYYRGPLHPHQPPKATDPASREFIPGPFTLPRAALTYQSTIAPDIMTLAYHHYPPGYEAAPKAPRLRTWDDSSPYHKNRPTRGPRGGDTLRLLRPPITFRNVPRLDKITVHSFVRAASNDSAALHVAGMAMQAITGVRATPHKARQNVVAWNLKKGKHVAVTCELNGEYMYHFISKLVDVVLPRIKDYGGIAEKSGDGSGNFTLGIAREHVAYFPEIEVNYDFYPPKMIPGCSVSIKTTATSDRDGKLLLSSLGIPFED